MQGLYAVYVKDVERSSKYFVKAVMLCMLKMPKETQNTLLGLITFLLITFLIFNSFSIQTKFWKAET